MDDTEKQFERLVASIDYPMFLVTTVASDGERSGCLVGFASQVSIKPKRFLIGLSEANHTHAVAQRATHLGVHVVGTEHQEIAELFGGETSDEVDKFARVAWHEGPFGIPLLDAIGGWFVGRILERIPLGDHLGHVLEPVAAHATAVDNLQFGEARKIEAGHRP